MSSAFDPLSLGEVSERQVAAVIGTSAVCLLLCPSWAVAGLAELGCLSLLEDPLFATTPVCLSITSFDLSPSSVSARGGALPVPPLLQWKTCLAQCMLGLLLLGRCVEKRLACALVWNSTLFACPIVMSCVRSREPRHCRLWFPRWML